MTASIDKTYRKETLEFNSQNPVNKYYSITSIFLKNFVLTVPFLIIVFVLSFAAPFVPNLKYGYSGQRPVTFKGYISLVFKNDMYLLLIIFSIIFITSIIEYLRKRFDNNAGYIKVGNFEVTKILNRGYFKVIHLNNKQRLKIKNTDKRFDRLAVGQVIEIQKTASNKLISYKLLT